MNVAGAESTVADERETEQVLLTCAQVKRLLAGVIVKLSDNVRVLLSEHTLDCRCSALGCKTVRRIFRSWPEEPISQGMVLRLEAHVAECVKCSTDEHEAKLAEMHTLLEDDAVPAVTDEDGTTHLVN
jgi:hypothetical protein